MTIAKPIPSGWSRGRFLVVVAALFAGQVGWVLLLGERLRSFPSPLAPRAELRLINPPFSDETWTKYVFAGDPTVFASSSPHAFADLAWRSLPGNDYAVPLPEPAPAFLEFAVRRPAPDVNPPISSSLRIPFQLAGQSDPSASHRPAFPPAEASRPESFVRIAGALGVRQIGPPSALPVWTTNFLVTNSVVQFGVDRAGQVFSTALLAGSGLPDADDAALSIVKQFRFRPVAQSAAEYAWDTATFYWKTIPPP